MEEMQNTADAQNFISTPKDMVIHTGRVQPSLYTKCISTHTRIACVHAEK